MGNESCDGCAVVLGAAGGIGSEVSTALARQGLELHLVDKSADGLQGVCERVRVAGANAATAWPINLSDADADAGMSRVATTVAASGLPLMVLVHCVGIGGWGLVEQTGEDQWDDIVSTNLRSAFVAARQLVPLLKQHVGSSAILVTSDSAEYGFAGRTAYCASKFGLAGFAAALREELRPSGVRVCVVKMSRVDTDFNGGTTGSQPFALSAAAVAEVVGFVVAQAPLVEIRELTMTSTASPYGPEPAVLTVPAQSATEGQL